MDFGDEYPSAQVYGLDLSPIQPSWVPPNVRFEVDDIEDEWTWKKDHFSLIYCRIMSGAVHDWSRLMTSVYEHLIPGGYFEIADVDTQIYSQVNNSLHETSSL